MVAIKEQLLDGFEEVVTLWTEMDSSRIDVVVASWATVHIAREIY